MAEYEDNLKQAIKQRQKNLKAGVAGKKMMSLKTSSDDLPKAPKKLSSCSTHDTTQLYFEGCMVPNNEVYADQTYARNQTPTEIYELKVFEKKQKVYQGHIQMQAQQQVSDLFMGSDLFSLFFCGESNKSTTAEVPMSPEEGSEQPTVPNFCASIY